MSPRSDPASHLPPARLESIRRRLENARLQELLAKLSALRETRSKMMRLERSLADDYRELRPDDADSIVRSATVEDPPPPATLAEAFAQASDIERSVIDAYREMKSMEMAMKRTTSLADMRALVDVARPDRKIDGLEELGASVATKSALDRQKELQTAVLSEVSGMQETTSSMLREAEAIAGVETAHDERLESMRRAVALSEALVESAAEDGENKSKDMAALMGGASLRGGSAVAAVAPPDSAINGGTSAPGNRLRIDAEDGDGVPCKWMYVDSWYVIGPFPNPGRINLRRKFAPETIQDLDATYEGKDGRTVRWEFVQAHNADTRCWWQPWIPNTAEVVPRHMEEYGIYYAVTDVFMDEECDRWMAIGSDDRSDLWINDQPVWGSSSELKAWRLAEDFRRVHFRKGRNKLLMRIENGPQDCGWSVCIATEEGGRSQ